jgi:3D (Asp-Asp-Asp) domain-containing protein
MTPIFTSALTGLLLLSSAATTSIQTPDWTKNAPPEPTYEYLTVAMSGYNAVVGQTDDTPFITASGAPTNSEITAARSRDLADELPFGTVIEIIPGNATSTPSCELGAVQDSIGYRIITDTMNVRIHNHIDVLFGNKDKRFIGGRTLNAARAMGWCNGIDIRVVGHVDMSNLPTTQHELQEMFGGETQLAVR